MQQNDDGTYTVQIAQSGVCDAQGTILPPEELKRALGELKEKRPLLFGEIERPSFESVQAQIAANLPDHEKPLAKLLARDEYVRRYIQIDETKVSHVVDLSTLQFDGDRVFANVKPTGIHGEALKKLLEGKPPTIGMRSLVQYEEGNTTRTQNHVVSRLDIVTFDLINPDQ
jgi:hypothetical protein